MYKKPSQCPENFFFKFAIQQNKISDKLILIIDYNNIKKIKRLPVALI